jgi:eukaryotic-like serine/threonine-protein kinase
LFRYAPSPVHAGVLVPVPVHVDRVTGTVAACGEAPATPVLVVAAVARASPAERAGVRAGDRIVRVAGERDAAAMARALRSQAPNDEVRIEVAEGETVRPLALTGAGGSGVEAIVTAYPFVCSRRNEIGALPECEVHLPSGSWLFLLRCDGHEDLRLPLHVAGTPRAVVLRATLLADGTSPAGFLRIAAGDFHAGPGSPEDPAGQRWIEDFWIGRTEVTVAEYRAFLHDPAGQQEIARGRSRGEWVLVPRQRLGERETRLVHRPLWTPNAQGLFEPPPGTDPHAPITAISGEDAIAYCRWRTDQAHRRGQAWTFRLPTMDEWQKAARGADGRRFPWGNAFDPRLCTVDPAASTPPPVLAVAGDESPFGVRGMAGGALEWNIGIVASSEMQVWQGGTWRGRSAEEFECDQPRGGLPWRVSGQDGLRVVAVR